MFALNLKSVHKHQHCWQKQQAFVVRGNQGAGLRTGT